MAFRARAICSNPECQCAKETIVCDSFEEYTDEFCARCGWEKMDHKPLTEIQYIKSKLGAITPGAWKPSFGGDFQSLKINSGSVVIDIWDGTHQVPPHGDYVNSPDMEFIANAPWMMKTLLDVIDSIQAKTSDWHDDYAKKKSDSFHVDEVTNAFDDAGHDIDTIISDALDSPVVGTGGAWAIKINGGTLSVHPTRFSAMFSAEAARKRGDHVDVYAEIYTEGAHSWELQPL